MAAPGEKNTGPAARIKCGCGETQGAEGEGHMQGHPSSQNQKTQNKRAGPFPSLTQDARVMEPGTGHL